MKNKFKQLLVFAITACLGFAVFALSACDDETNNGDPAKDGYIVTVLYPDGKPLKGSDGDTQWDFPSVELVDADGNRVAENAWSRLSESGVAQIPYTVPGEYYMRVIDCPAGYFYDYLSEKTSAKRAYYTIKLTKAEPSAYTFNLKHVDGTAANIQDVEITLYNGRDKVTSANTNAQGVAVTEVIERGEYDVTFSVSGYIYKPFTTTAGKTETDITLYRFFTLPLDTPLAGDELEKWDSALNAPSIGIERFDRTVNNYVYSVDLAKGEEVFYTFTAPKTGAYRIGSMRGNDYKIQIYNNDFTTTYDDFAIASTEYMPNQVTPEIRVEQGDRLSFSVQHNSDKDGAVEFIVCPPAYYIETVTATAEGEYTLVFDVDSRNECILEFPTSVAGLGQGVYEFTSMLSASDNLDVYLVKYVNDMPLRSDSNSLGQTDDIKEAHRGCVGDDNGAGDGKNFKYTEKLRPSYVGPTLQYHVVIKGDKITSRTEIKVKITRTGDAQDKTVTQHTAKVSATTKCQDNIPGTFTWVDFTKNNSITQSDGKWYIDTNGEQKQLFVNIKTPIRGLPFSFATVEYFGENDYTPGQKQNSKLNLTTSSTEDEEVKWNYDGFIEKYANELANNQGVYELNIELKEFLDRYMEQFYGDFAEIDESTHSPIKPAEPYLIGCGYFA